MNSDEIEKVEATVRQSGVLKDLTWILNDLVSEPSAWLTERMLQPKFSNDKPRDFVHFQTEKSGPAKKSCRFRISEIEYELTLYLKKLPLFTIRFLDRDKSCGLLVLRRSDQIVLESVVTTTVVGINGERIEPTRYIEFTKLGSWIEEISSFRKNCDRFADDEYQEILNKRKVNKQMRYKSEEDR